MTVTLSENVERRLRADSELRYREATRAIMAIIRNGSDELQILLENILERGLLTTNAGDIAAYVRHDTRVIDEFRRMTTQYKVTIDDFSLVLQYAVAE